MKRYITILLFVYPAILFSQIDTFRLPFNSIKLSENGEYYKTTLGATRLEQKTTLDAFNFNKPILVNGSPISGGTVSSDSSWYKIRVGNPSTGDTTRIDSDGIASVIDGKNFLINGDETYLQTISTNGGGMAVYTTGSDIGIISSSTDIPIVSESATSDTLIDVRKGSGRSRFVVDSSGKWLFKDGTFFKQGVSHYPAPNTGIWSPVYDSEGDSLTWGQAPASTDVNIHYRSLKVGTGDDTLTVSSAGNVRLYNDATQWEDLNFNPLSSAVGATAPDNVTINNTLHKEFTSANNQTCGDSKEIPHAYKLGSSLTPHIHIFLKGGESAGTTGVTFTFYWELRQTTGTTSGSATLSATSAQLTGNANKIDISSTAFSGSAELGGQLSITIARTGGDAGDVVVSSFGVHYEVDSFGSNLITTK